MKNKAKIINQIKGGLIVSVQADKYEPLGRPEIMAAMAQTVVMGGAVGIRACYPENISAILKTVDVPVIGIHKEIYPGSDVFITPTLKEVRAILAVNPQIIALDATNRIRPEKADIRELVNIIRNESDCLIVADISTFTEGLKAAEMGFDFIATTLVGYTADTQTNFDPYHPDFDMLNRLVTSLAGTVPVIAEGRIWETNDLKKIFQIGVLSVVIGSAITRPQNITKRFVEALT